MNQVRHKGEFQRARRTPDAGPALLAQGWSRAPRAVSTLALILAPKIALTLALATMLAIFAPSVRAQLTPGNPGKIKVAPAAVFAAPGNDVRTAAQPAAKAESTDSSVRIDTVAIEMFAGETRVLPGIDAARVAVGNGRVLSASALDQRELLLIANDTGTTTVHIWCRDGRRQRLNVHVRPSDMARTTREILDFLSDLPNVRARAVGDKVLIEGERLTDEQQFKIDELARRYPQIVNFTARVGWEQMILMDIKVVEFNKQRLRDLGVRWDAGTAGPNAGVAGDVARNGAFVVNPPSGGISAVDARTQAIDPFRWYFGIVASLSSRLNVYERNGEAVVLAAPQLTARSGSSARFQAGGEIPYSVMSQNGFVSVQFRSFGIIIEVRPRADASGAVRSEIVAEVSEPDASISTLQGVPAIRTRKTQTEFNVRTGETMVLSGLLDRRKGETIEKVPGLGDLPILGALFKSKRFENNESELVIFVTPRIVTAESDVLEQTRRRLEDGGDRYLNGDENTQSEPPLDATSPRPNSRAPSSPRSLPAAPQSSTYRAPETRATARTTSVAAAAAEESVSAASTLVLAGALPAAPQSARYSPPPNSNPGFADATNTATASLKTIPRDAATPRATH